MTAATLAGKNVVIIGGTAGIGLATAIAAAEQGAKVWAAGRSEANLEKARAVANGKFEVRQADTHDAEALQKIFEEGVYKWRRESRYYQQSKVENTFYRYKTILGKKLRARREESRHVETVIGRNILNCFLEMGRCKSEMVL